MKVCKKCKGNKIKSRRNYSHGRNSKGITTLSCKNCGSTDLESRSENKGRQRRTR